MTFVSDPVRPKGQEHIPKYTKGFVVLRIFQFIVGLVVLGLAGYSVALVPFVGNCLSLFTVWDNAPLPSYTMTPSQHY